MEDATVTIDKTGENRNESFAKLIDSLKVDGGQHLRFHTSDKIFDSPKTRQNYSAMKLIAQTDTVNVHWSLNDGNAAHVSDFRFMATVIMYSIDAVTTQTGDDDFF